MGLRLYKARLEGLKEMVCYDGFKRKRLIFNTKPTSRLSFSSDLHEKDSYSIEK